VRGDQLASIEHNYAWFLCQQNRFNDAQRHFDKALAQPSYRQTDKTLKAIGFCQARAGALPQL
jgi:type IV pilus assembly protein PilF